MTRSGCCAVGFYPSGASLAVQDTFRCRPGCTGCWELCAWLPLGAWCGCTCAANWHSERWSLTLLLLAVASVALGIWQYSLTALGTDQGRLLFPALGAIVVLLAAGLLAWLPERRLGIGAAVLGAASMALGVYALVGVLAPAFAPPVEASDGEWQPAALVAPVSFGELALIGYTLDPDPVLYWRAAAAPAQDRRTVLRVTSEDGSLVWEWRRSPGAGRWSTDRWPQSTVVRDAYAVQWPDWAPPAAIASRWAWSRTTRNRQCHNRMASRPPSATTRIFCLAGSSARPGHRLKAISEAMSKREVLPAPPIDSTRPPGLALGRRGLRGADRTRRRVAGGRADAARSAELPRCVDERLPRL